MRRAAGASPPEVELKALRERARAFEDRARAAEAGLVAEKAARGKAEAEADRALAELDAKARDFASLKARLQGSAPLCSLCFSTAVG